MDDTNEKMVKVQKDSSENVVTSAISSPTTRRTFLKSAAIGGAIVAGLPLVTGNTPVEAGSGYVPDAKMMLHHDAYRCVGCKRCEVACSLTHDDKISPSIARIKITRNWSFGPDGPRISFKSGQGMFGDCRIIADTCQQCAHPTPCMTACPNGAIEVDDKTNARVINTRKCKGCGLCQTACPWAMTSLDSEAKKATKCDLCGGDPQCAKVCPGGALSLVPWRDKSREVRTRQAVMAVDDSCNTCHKS